MVWNDDQLVVQSLFDGISLTEKATMKHREDLFFGKSQPYFF